MILAAVGLLAVGIFLFFPRADAELIYVHMVIHGVPVGGMTAEEADTALRERFAPELEALQLRFALDGDEVAVRNFAAFGVWFDFADVVEAAREYSNERNMRRRMARLLGRPHEIDMLPVFRFDADNVDAIVRELAADLNQTPVNARFYHQNGAITVKPGAMGRTMDINAAISATTEALAALADSTVALHVEAVRPRYTRDDLNFTVSVLGAYQTPQLGNANDARARNIDRASSRIHNQFILPGEVFSAGTVIAAHLPDSGYEAALVLVRGQPVEDVGGGVCQVATTLYNAVLRAELTVVQRHNHSAPVSYADYGFDATLAGTWYDLKFKNSTNQPILLTSEITGGRLYITIHGYETRAAGRTIRFTSERTSIIEPDPCRVVTDTTLAPGERIRKQDPVRGFTYEVFKHIYQNGTFQSRERVNVSTYRALPGLVHAGE